MQSETILDLNKTSQALALVQEEVPDLRKFADTYRSENVLMFSNTTVILLFAVVTLARKLFPFLFPVVVYLRTKN